MEIGAGRKELRKSTLRSASAPAPTQARDQLIYNTCVILEYVNRKVSGRLREEVLPP